MDVGVDVGVIVGVDVDVGVAVDVNVSVEVDVGVGVKVAVGVMVGVFVFCGVGVIVGVRVIVGVGVGPVIDMIAWSVSGVFNPSLTVSTKIKFPGADGVKFVKLVDGLESWFALMSGPKLIDQEKL